MASRAGIWHGTGSPMNTMRRLFLILLVVGVHCQADGETLRVVAANLTSGRHQEYSPDNSNHSNPEGAGARILKALRPDVVLIQEFSTTIPVRQWVNRTFGPEFSFFREDQKDVPNFIPNGVISRFPIIESGVWDDPAMTNREFAWAKIRLPNGRNLWAISVHFYAQKPEIRTREAQALVEKIQSVIPAEDLVVLGGDLNTRNRDEECVTVLRALFPAPEAEPADQEGNENTNGNRNRPYDWILVDTDLAAWTAPVTLAGEEFPGGLVFDSRVFTPLSAVPPVQPGDSATFNMQHMAVVRDFALP